MLPPENVQPTETLGNTDIQEPLHWFITDTSAQHAAAFLVFEYVFLSARQNLASRHFFSTVNMQRRKKTEFSLKENFHSERGELFSLINY